MMPLHKPDVVKSKRVDEKYVYSRTIQMKIALCLLTGAFASFTIAISTESWNYDSHSGFRQGLWQMFRCTSFDMETCIEIMFGEDIRLVLLQVFMGICYAFLILAYLHALLQFFSPVWYTRIQAGVSVAILTLSVVSFMVGFTIYLQRPRASNFSLHIVFGFSAHFALAAMFMLLLGLGIFGIEIAIRSVDEDRHVRGMREMKNMVVKGPPPKRQLPQKDEFQGPRVAQVTTAITGILFAAEKLRQASLAQSSNVPLLVQPDIAPDAKDSIRKKSKIKQRRSISSISSQSSKKRIKRTRSKSKKSANILEI